MSFEIKDNTFTLFANDKKGNEKRPDFTGKGKINGKEIRVSVWKQTGQSGIEYMSGHIEEPFVKQEEPEQKVEKIEDEIPF